MTNPRIAVIGVPGKWSTEVLAERIAAKTGACPVIDMAEGVCQFHFCHCTLSSEVAREPLHGTTLPHLFVKRSLRLQRRVR